MEKTMKRYLFIFMLFVVMITYAQRNLSPNNSQFKVLECDQTCLPELPRTPIGPSLRGRTYPWYYQGYPYFGVYNYGSYRGISYSI